MTKISQAIDGNAVRTGLLGDMWRARENQAKLVAPCCYKGARKLVHIYDIHGCSMIIYLCFGREFYISSCRLLIYCRTHGESRLCNSLHCSILRWTEALLNLSADPNTQDQINETPLHYAAFAGQLDCVKLPPGFSLELPQCFARKWEEGQMIKPSVCSQSLFFSACFWEHPRNFSYSYDPQHYI